MAQRLLSTHRGLAGLARASFGELAQEHGMGTAKTALTLAAMELDTKHHVLASPTRWVREGVAATVGRRTPALAVDSDRQLGDFSLQVSWIQL